MYNAYSHPLSHIPGLKITAITSLQWAPHIRNGTLARYVQTLHEQYGEVVGVAPNELSFICGETAWQDMHGLRTGKRNAGAYLKDPTFFPLPLNG